MASRCSALAATKLVGSVAEAGDCGKASSAGSGSASDANRRFMVSGSSYRVAPRAICQPSYVDAATLVHRGNRDQIDIGLGLLRHRDLHDWRVTEAREPD